MGGTEGSGAAGEREESADKNYGKEDGYEADRPNHRNGKVFGISAHGSFSWGSGDGRREVSAV